MQQRIEWAEERSATRAVQIDELVDRMRQQYERTSEPSPTVPAAGDPTAGPEGAATAEHMTAELTVQDDVVHLTLKVQGSV